MRLKVFLSWSGNRSKKIAKELHSWLPRVIQAIDPWMSDEDIKKGERWNEKIGVGLEEHTIGIICITPENLRSEWLLFEAGAISKAVGKSRVYPLLFGMSVSPLTGPLSIFQSTIFEKDDFFKLMASLNDQLELQKVNIKILADTYDDLWPRLERNISALKDSKLDFDPTSLPDILSSFSNSDIPKPSIESSAFFTEGFESHSLYEIITSHAKTRLYNYSRMNRKLMDKEYHFFFEQLSERIRNGFDLRLLFLNPNAPEYVIRSAHSDPDFREQLKTAINNAIKVLSRCGIDPDIHCRMYESVRTTAMTIVDDAVFFAPVKNIDGDVQPLTKTSFKLIHIKSHFGSELAMDFESEWQNGKTLIP